MTAVLDRSRDRPRDGLAPRADRDTMGPDVGLKVSDEPLRAIKVILWSVTLTRIVLIPAFVVGAARAQALALQGADVGMLRWGLLMTLAVIGASDILDGWIARRFGLASQAGAVVDALADKLVQLTLVGFFAFSQGPAFASLPVWFFGLVLGRDLILGGGWLALRARSIPFTLVHRAHGRLATVGVFVLLFWLTAGIEAQGFAALVLLSAALIWLTVASYVGDTWKGVRT